MDIQKGQITLSPNHLQPFSKLAKILWPPFPFPVDVINKLPLSHLQQNSPILQFWLKILMLTKKHQINDIVKEDVKHFYQESYHFSLQICSSLTFTWRLSIVSEKSELIKLFHSCYSNRLREFSVTIPRCYKNVSVNSFFPYI